MPEFVFDKSTSQYRNKSNSRPVSDVKLFAEVEKAVNRGQKKLERIAKQHEKDKINRAEWVIQTGEEIKAMYRAVMMIGYGGKNAMGPREWGFVGSVVREQLTYLNSFANQIDNDLVKLDAAFVRRAASYAQSAYAAYAQAVGRRLQRDGIQGEEENILEAGAEHCEGCLNATAAGRVPIGTLTPIGHRDCKGRCRCRIVTYRTEV